MTTTEIEAAIDLQARSFAFLQWLESALDRGFIFPGRAETHGRGRLGTLDWFQTFFENIPPAVRGDRESLDRLAGFVSTYLKGTFNLDEDPGEFIYSEDGHCFCPCCSYMRQRSHLRPRRTQNADRKAAETMMMRHLRSLTEELGHEVRETTLLRLLKDRPVREDLALLTYIVNVEERAQGRVVGAAPLVLWRLFAWNDQGSPKKKWKLTTRLVEKAQEHLLVML